MYPVCSLVASITSDSAVAQFFSISLMSLIHDTGVSMVGSLMFARGGLQAPESRLAWAVDRLIDERSGSTSRKA